ncbi:Alcohol dehydrogenase zinc-binding domain protein [Beutenbergia cavernae DSM 12333]|uniref:Alcohol dehydrogenase zinc-binding domain protein n=1 Tax=Beutenbergia cavernae (strain ATCC BAA-8 / DSM 12333 / CCUG 43141 / JCM 11478 / NBRC 16432 / NCIMB 13614 / HKI 0122) TaxID=471853 RepID=C5C346_BEUC1|nr:2,3-butanediol dehydrogenase [Beutenbergia cavernae]ACQ79745.1 Alcohol dehydrogenase zinc-binding domain protein [Beutenbergia cavernae DSM 12333]
MGDLSTATATRTDTPLPEVMTAVRWWARGDVRVDSVAVPGDLETGWVLVEVEACGICGTDLEEYLHGPIVSPVEPHPLTGAQVPVTLGHETVGRIVRSNDPDAPPVGTLVAVEGNRFCGECFWCLRREFPLCRMLGSLGQMGDGGLADYLAAPGYMCVPLPAGLPAAEATLVEPLSVVVRALRRRARIADGSIAVVGAGTLGLLAVQAAKAMGARDVVAIDPQPGRRALALTLGADAALDVDEVHLLADRYPAGGPDWALECAGSTAAAETALGLVRRGGTAVLVGVHDAPIPVNMLRLVLDERTITASVSHVWDEDFPEAIRLLSSGAVTAAPLVTSVIPLSRTVADGMDVLARGGSDQIKIVVVPDSKVPS